MKQIYQQLEDFRLGPCRTVEVPITAAGVPQEILFPQSLMLNDKLITRIEAYFYDGRYNSIQYAPSGAPVVNYGTFLNSYLILRNEHKQELIRRFPLFELTKNPFSNLLDVYSGLLIDDKKFYWDNSSVLIADVVGAPFPATPGEVFLFTVYYHEPEYKNWVSKQLQNLKSFVNAQR